MRRRGRPRHPDVLTPREWEVLALLRADRTNQEIADELGVTLATARFHVSEIMGKLGVASRYEAALWQPDREAPRRGWAHGLAGWLTIRMNWATAGAAVGTMTIAGVVLFVAALAWGLGHASQEQANGGDICTYADFYRPSNADIGVRPTPDLRPASTREAEIEGFRQQRIDWMRRFISAGCEARLLPVVEFGTPDGRFAGTVSEMVAGADFIITGRVTATVFTVDEQDSSMPRAHETVAIERTLKGDVAGSVTLDQFGGPTPDNGGSLASTRGDQVLLPGDQVLLFVQRSADGGYQSEYPVGKFFIRNGFVYAALHNPCGESLHGWKLEDAIGMIDGWLSGENVETAQRCDYSGF